VATIQRLDKSASSATDPMRLSLRMSQTPVIRVVLPFPAIQFVTPQWSVGPMAINLARRKFIAALGAATVAWPLAALLTDFVTAAVGEQTSPAAPGSSDKVKAIALEWFEHLQAGQIDRAQMTTAFSEHLTDEAVREMAHYLKSYGPPAGEEIIQSRTIQDQTFYVVKFLLQRGDALSMIIGFDENGNVSGITFASMGQE
jgi:hypothetical protein